MAWVPPYQDVAPAYCVCMKKTQVDEQGTVRCPKCGASAFAQKRSVKGKIALGLLAPKRTKCLGCGSMLKQ
jgi:hypothetical protein